MFERVGILGGTFDPIHRAHVELTEWLSAELGWSRAIVMPAWQQPFKSGRSSAFHRHAMAVLATLGRADLQVSLLELERNETSYTVDTLEILAREMPEASLEWVIGDDNLADLMRWKDPVRLLELANLIVLRRGEGNVPAPLESRVMGRVGRPRAGAIVFAENKVQDVSSTEIRRRVADGEPIDGLVHPDVMHYISKTGLYQTVR